MYLYKNERMIMKDEHIIVAFFSFSPMKDINI